MRPLTKILTMPFAGLLIAGACIAALGFALIMQYGFDVMPCQLCLWQRGPFALAAVLSLCAVVVRPYGRFATWMLMLCGLLFLANAGLAVFHSGVERHWWEFHSSCTGTVLQHVDSVEAMREQLLAVPVVRCDQIVWSLFGFSMANFNAVFSLGLAVISALAACRVKGGRPR